MRVVSHHDFSIIVIMMIMIIITIIIIIQLVLIIIWLPHHDSSYFTHIMPGSELSSSVEAADTHTIHNSLACTVFSPQVLSWHHQPQWKWMTKKKEELLLHPLTLAHQPL